jgi:hypothetical protein
MNRKPLVILTMLGLIIQVNLYSQNPLLPSPVIGLRQDVFFNIMANKDRFTDETIFAVSLPVYLKTGRHECYTGFIIPLLVPATNGEYYLNKWSVGAMAGYRFYFFNPLHSTNLYFQHEFQYIYFTGKYEFASHSDVSYYNTIYGYVRNIIGFGFSQFFDKKQHVGISFGCGYIIPFNYYKKIGKTSSYSEWTYWSEPYMNNYLNFNFDINIKLAAFHKVKK